MMTVKILPNDRQNPPGKLADVELHFTGASEHQQAAYHIALSTWGPADHVSQAIKEGIDAANVLAGLKLAGFGIWERRTGGGRNVTFPARSYAINGERRSFALLRGIGDDVLGAQDRVRDLILAAYAEYEALAATA